MLTIFSIIVPHGTKFDSKTFKQPISNILNLFLIKLVKISYIETQDKSSSFEDRKLRNIVSYKTLQIYHNNSRQIITHVVVPLKLPSTCCCSLSPAKRLNVSSVLCDLLNVDKEFFNGLANVVVTISNSLIHNGDHLSEVT